MLVGFDVYLVAKVLVFFQGLEVPLLSRSFVDDPVVILTTGLVGYFVIAVGTAYLGVIEVVERERQEFEYDTVNRNVLLPVFVRERTNRRLGTAIVCTGVLFIGFSFLLLAI